MKRFQSIVLAVIAAVFAVAYALPTLPAHAQSSAALSITPKKNYVIEPGKSAKDKLTIRNLDNSKDLDLTLRVVDFSYTDDGGTPKLMLAEDAPQTTWSLKPFLKVPKTVKIPAKQSKTIDMSVAVPAGHGAGSYYSAIVYSSSSPDGGLVGLNASGVTLAFVEIPGEVKQDLTLEKFGAYSQAVGDKKASYVSLTMNEPKNMAFTLKNSGNVTEKPDGSITLKGMFGQEYTVGDINPNESLALIGQSRTYVSCIKLKEADVNFNGASSRTKTCASAGLWPGYYTANLDLHYARNGNPTKDIPGSASFWYLPLWFVVVVLVLLVAIGFGIWMLVRKFRGSATSSRAKKSSRRR